MPQRTEAQTLLLDTEHEHELNRLAEACHARFAPQDEVEEDLVGQFIAASWRLRRLYRVETGVYDLEAAGCDSSDLEDFSRREKEALLYRRLSGQTRLLSDIDRQEGRLRRAYDRALHNLLLLQRNRPSPEHPPPAAGKRKRRNEPGEPQSRPFLVPAAAARPF
ncbi:MAG: hypothetical protein HY235_13830 [Acidobacteria bacterium]|nr:hypothetical protein [Acidobacteriota bacterium]